MVSFCCLVARFQSYVCIVKCRNEGFECIFNAEVILVVWSANKQNVRSIVLAQYSHTLCTNSTLGCPFHRPRPRLCLSYFSIFIFIFDISAEVQQNLEQTAVHSLYPIAQKSFFFFFDSFAHLFQIHSWFFFFLFSVFENNVGSHLGEHTWFWLQLFLFKPQSAEH